MHSGDVRESSPCPKRATDTVGQEIPFNYITETPETRNEAPFELTTSPATEVVDWLITSPPLKKARSNTREDRGSGLVRLLSTRIPAPMDVTPPAP